MKTVVIFRKFKGETIAIFPEIPGTTDLGTCQAYAHDGGHFSFFLSTKTERCESAETLKKELIDIGYDLVEVKRVTKKHFNARKNLLM